ncbi:MAG: Ig-like domain-containing protein, partial [Propionibacteriaceae bacterium]|nr:Ig-like domain-containing protein [Propionibacteriaceae bacterium]
APAAPVVTAPAAGWLNDATPAVTGTGEAGATVTVKDGGGNLLCTTTVAPANTWSCPVPAPGFGAGPASLTVTQTDPAGHVSGPQTVAVTVDTLPPAAPVVTTANATAVAGTAEAGTTVTVTWPDATTSEVLADGTGAWSVPTPTGLVSGPVTAVAVDAAGNASPPAPADLNLDAPDAPDIVTANATVIAGTVPKPVEAGTTVTVTYPTSGGTATVTADVDPVTGEWSVPTPADAVNGTLSVVAVNPAHNQSSPGTGTLDVTAPAAPVVTAPAPGATVGDATPTLTGTGEPGATVTVSDGTDDLCTATVAPGGTWSCTPATALDEGPVTLVVTQTDPAGNESAARTVSLTVDTTPPAAPVVTAPAAGALVTTATPTIAGTGEAGATVTVMDGPTPVCTTTVGPDSTWSCVVPTALGEGPHTLSVTQADTAGNVSPAATRTVTVDTVAPGVPAVTTANATVIAGTVPAPVEAGVTVTVTYPTSGGPATVTADVDPATGTWSVATPADAISGAVTAVAADPAGNASAAGPGTLDVDAPAAPVVTPPGTVATATPTLAGTGEPGATVTVSDGAGQPLCTATVVPAGTWSCTATTLPEGPNSLSVTQADPAGNVSAATPMAVVVDTIPPAAPVVTVPAAGAALGNPTPTLAGTGEAGATVTVKDGGGHPLCTTTAGAGGTWTCTVTALADGPAALVVTQTDAAGHVSAATTVDVVIDTEAPGQPVIDTLTAAGAAGTAEAGATVTVTWPDATTSEVQADGTGHWSVPTPQDMTSGLVTVVATDAAGNTSAPATGALNLDPPDAPTVTTANATTIAGTVPTPVAAGTTVVVTYPVAGGTATVTADVDPVTGEWSVATPADAASGALTAVAVDSSSNRSGAGTGTLDVDAPAAPVVTSPAEGTAVGDPTPTISGTGEPGATATVTDGTTTLCTAMVAPGGTWSCTVPDDQAWSEGPVTLVVTQTDRAGNESPSTTVDLTVDLTAPAAPVVTAPAAGAAVGAVPLAVSGTGEAGAVVTVADGSGTPLCTATVGATGQWSCAATLAEGPATLVVTQTDEAGNESPSTTVDVTVDLTAPVIPVVTAPAAGAVLGDATPRVTGTGEAGATVTVADNQGRTLCTTTVTTTGAW